MGPGSPKRMKLVVGLGNPGRKYQGTRHNVGFDVLAEVASCHGAGRPRAKFDGEMVDLLLAGTRVLLLWPQTYMNLSGVSVGKACDFYNLKCGDLLVVCDDFHLPLGKLRIRPRGSAGGQKGLADVIRRLGSQEIARLRVGVGPLPERWDPVDFVLSRFARAEGVEIEQMVVQAADAVAAWACDEIEVCMNRFN
jgi:PTH1 family peptidyl-tRNA hydrolase